MKPSTLDEFFKFYYEEFKPIYSKVSADAAPPIELLFEANAAFDHLSRHWRYGESEEKTVGLASAHLKRATFDAFKLIQVQTKDRYAALQKIDTSIIDNGDFDKNLIKLWAEIRDKAIKARCAEGDARSPEAWPKAFELWKEVYVKCEELESQYYLSEKVSWARKKEHFNLIKNHVVSLVIGILSGVISYALIYYYL